MATAAKRLVVAVSVEVGIALACVGDGDDMVNEGGKDCAVVALAVEAKRVLGEEGVGKFLPAAGVTALGRVGASVGKPLRSEGGRDGSGS